MHLCVEKNHSEDMVMLRYCDVPKKILYCRSMYLCQSMCLCVEKKHSEDMVMCRKKYFSVGLCTYVNLCIYVLKKIIVRIW